MGAGGGEKRFGMLSVGDGGATAGGGVVGKKLPNPNCARHDPISRLMIINEIVNLIWPMMIS
jgi:hypothetical protein